MIVSNIVSNGSHTENDIKEMNLSCSVQQIEERYFFIDRRMEIGESDNPRRFTNETFQVLVEGRIEAFIMKASN